MNVLVTSSRMPFALDEIRKFGRRGHRVVAADSIYTAPGSHSRYVAERAHLAPAESQPARFFADVSRIVAAHAIDLLVPCFEEVFYLAQHLRELSARARVFASDLGLLLGLHHKGAFNALARRLGLATPHTTLVQSRAELAAATRDYPRYLARPAWSRGGVDILTNAGPLAGALRVEDCAPTTAQPWIVQEFVDGEDRCSFTIAQHGHVVAHCTYVHPRQLEHGGGIVFESIDDPETLCCVTRVVEATGYHGQISLDFVRGRRGLIALECNPRPTAGVHLMPDEMFVDAVLAPPRGRVRVVPAGIRRMYASAVLRDLLLHWPQAKADLAYLFSDADDIYGEHGDRLPALFQLLSYAQVLSYRMRHPGHARPGTKLAQAYFEGITYDGQAIP